jgi:hypothetical protein
MLVHDDRYVGEYRILPKVDPNQSDRDEQNLTISCGIHIKGVSKANVVVLEPCTECTQPANFPTVVRVNVVGIVFARS